MEMPVLTASYFLQLLLVVLVLSLEVVLVLTPFRSVLPSQTLAPPFKVVVDLM
jgi:hypothetical protein